MRPIIAILAVVVAVASFVLARMELALLDAPSAVNASAVQIAQVHAQAQTDILVGILFLITLLVVMQAIREPISSAPSGAPTPAPEA